MKDNLSDIKTPEELLTFMSKNILYGYLSKEGKIYYQDDINFANDFSKNYILESEQDILKTKVGNCFDQVEFERNWFIKNNYEFKTFFMMVMLNYPNNYPMHSFLLYKDKLSNKWFYFENAAFKYRGIKEFLNINAAISYVKKWYEEDINNDFKDKIILKEYKKVEPHVNLEEYLDFILD